MVDFTLRLLAGTGIPLWARLFRGLCPRRVFISFLAPKHRRFETSRASLYGDPDGADCEGCWEKDNRSCVRAAWQLLV